MDFKKVVLPKNNKLKITKDHKFIVLFKVNSEKSMYVSSIRSPNLDEFSGIGLVSFTSDINNAKVFTYQELKDSEVKFIAFRETIVDLLPDCYYKFFEVYKNIYIYKRSTFLETFYLSEDEIPNQIDYEISSKNASVDFVDLMEQVNLRNSRINCLSKAMDFLKQELSNKPDFKNLTVEFFTPDSTFITIRFEGLSNSFSVVGSDMNYRKVSVKPNIKYSKYTRYRKIFQDVCGYVNITQDQFNATLRNILIKLFNENIVLNELTDLDMRVETK